MLSRDREVACVSRAINSMRARAMALRDGLVTDLGFSSSEPDLRGLGKRVYRYDEMCNRIVTSVKDARARTSSSSHPLPVQTS